MLSRAKGRLTAIRHGANPRIARNIPPEIKKKALEELSVRWEKEAHAALDAMQGVREQATYAQLSSAAKDATQMTQLLKKQPTSIVQYVGKRDPREVLVELLLEDAKEHAVDAITDA